MSDHGTWREPTPAWAEGEEFGESPGTAVLLASVAALGGFLFGYDTAVINGAVAAIDDEYNASNLALGLTVSAALLGSAVGAMIAGRLADRYGRLHAMRAAALLFFISAVGSGLAWSLASLAVFRVVGGIAVGVASVIAPAYIAEIAPARIRGRLGSLQQLAIVTGIFLALLVDYAVAAAAGGSKNEWLLGLEAWRWMFLAMTVPSLAYGVLSFTIPESPRWLVARDRLPEARRVLGRLLGDQGVNRKIGQIQDTLQHETVPSWRDLRHPKLGLLPLVWVGIGLSVFQQFVGINVIFYYSSVLWQAVGFSESDSLLITVITSVVNIVTTLVAISLIDKLGRRPLLLIGSAGMAVSLGLMAVAFTQATGSGDDISLSGPWGIIALICANAFVVFFGASWGPLVWVLLGEMFPNRIRAAALGVAAAMQWIANFAITLTFPPMLAAFGASVPYLMYAAFAALSFFFVLTKVPETKGMELEDMVEQGRTKA